MIYLLLLCHCVGAPWLHNAHSKPGTDWWYDMGDTWDTSNNLAYNNQYYKMYRQSAAQLDWHGYALHVGKINRGQFVSPEMSMPRHRAFGHQADFNPEDLRFGTFKYKPQGQRFRAGKVHVNLGLANYVGEVRTMPLGQHVQADGSVLVKTSPRQRSPCHPDPCKHFAFHTCTPVNDGTAKCSESGKVQLILTGFDLSDNAVPNFNYLELVPEYHDGSECSTGDCGVVVDNDSDYYDYYDDNSDGSKFIVTLTKLPDGSNYRDYTYAVFAIVVPDNASRSRTKVTVTVDGDVRQVLAVPQWDGTTNVNYDGKFFYFFGCFRPQTGFVDTRGAGFFDVGVDYGFGGFAFGEPGLCKALLGGWTGMPGFNPYEGSGTGTPQDPGWPF